MSKSTFEFHVWDFSDHIEVRLDAEFIEKLKTFRRSKTTEYRHYRSKQRIVITRNYWIFPEATPIGKRLFAAWNYHKNRKVPHLPFVTIPQLKEIHEKTKLSRILGPQEANFNRSDRSIRQGSQRKTWRLPW